MSLFWMLFACSTPPNPTPHQELASSPPRKKNISKRPRKKARPAPRRAAHAVFCPPGHKPLLSCTIKGKTKTLEVCQSSKGALTYYYGSKGQVDLTLERGEAEEQALASGTEYDFNFSSDSFIYNTYIVDSARSQDIGAGVIVTKDNKQIAQLACQDDFWADVAEL